jgi:uncharacterized protein YjdB
MATVQLTDSVDPGSAGFGSPQWQSSDESIVTITPAVDGASADVLAAGKLGTAQVSVTVQAGDQSLAGTLDVQVVAGSAASISISAGTPSEQ